MPTYKGNLGNLLQHWVLTQFVALIRDQVMSAGRLCFIDAHAMSPFAVRAEKPGPTAPAFDAVARGLPGQNTEYERAWSGLRGKRIEYPSSAQFVRYLWKGPLRLILCEADEETAAEIHEWLQVLREDTPWELHRGDWRARFCQSFPSISIAAHLISFDPYMFDRHGPPAHPGWGNMWPNDILRAGVAIHDLERGPVAVQLSTYSANNANSQDDVIACIEPLFRAAGLKLGATIRADGNMMSMVFVRGIRGVGNAKLHQRFQDGLGAHG